MQFLLLAEQTLDRRERDGIRGIKRERSRFRCHVRDTDLARMVIGEHKRRDIRTWLEELADKDAKGPGPKRKLSRATINRTLSFVSTVFTVAVEKELIEFNPEHLVFPTPSGTHWQQGKIFGRSSSARRYYAMAGISLRPYLHWHAQRHTFASNLVSGAYGRRWPLPEIQKVMGHSSVTITERYAHLGEDAIATAVRETIEAAARLAPPEVVEVPQIDEVIEVAPGPASIVMRAPEPARVEELRGLLGRVVGRLFGRKEVSHVV